MRKQLISLIVVVWMMQLIIPISISYATVFETEVNKKTSTISPGVLHSVFNYSTSSGVKESVQELEIDLTNPYANIDVGLSNPFTTLRKTSKLAELNTYANHQVVGAVNASYFTSKGPVGLIVVNNEIINHGYFGSGKESPTEQPVAFGIGADGKAIIGYYDLDVTFTIDGESYTINQIDGTRDADFNALYTPKQETTGTNIYGSELIVTGVQKDTTKVMIGDQWTGTIGSVQPYGLGNATVPKDGFVVSIQNKAIAEKLANATGKEITVSFSIDSKWQNAQFILGAGPLLVQNGQVNITMDTTSSFAKSRQPRTAVMVDSTGTKVNLVTVDGRQPGVSSGTSLVDLANLLVSKGAAYALNLDGGGSTTMVARIPGNPLAHLVNVPSDSSERAVSAILQVINNASVGSLASFEINGPTKVTQNDAASFSLTKGYDEFYNPITIDTSTIIWEVQGDIGYIENNQFIATKVGKGTITATVNGVTKSKEVEVTPFVTVRLIDSMQSVNKFTTSAVKGTTTIGLSQVGAEPSRNNSPVVKLSYAMSTSETGTSASYLHLNPSGTITGQPKKIGLWVYGDKKNHWLRGTVIDGTNTTHTINFTAQNGLNWSGWKFVEAIVPSNVTYPIKVDKIYLTEPVDAMKSSGAIYLNDLKAIYDENYKEPTFTDVDSKYWANNEITFFANKGYSNGYIDGTFKPASTITRGEAAVMMQRVLSLKATTTNNPFNDVKSTSYDYQAILAVNESKIMTGKSAGIFDSTGQLTRAEMAAILVRAFQLTGTADVSFPDVSNDFWCYNFISILVANNLVNGFDDGTYRPNAKISRAEFATFLYRVLTK